MNFARSSLALSVLGLCVGYVALSPLFAMPLYSNILFVPYKFPEGHYEVEEVVGTRKEETSIASADGKKIDVWYFRLPGATRTAIVSHGNGGNLTHRLDVARALLSAGASVVLYDYQGYGRSEGSPSLQGVVDDGLAVFRYVRDGLAVAPENIVLYGESLGTGVTCEMLKRVTCGGVILQSGFFSLQSVAQDRLKFLAVYPSFLFPKPSLDNASVLSHAHPPLLVMHGLRDTFLPPSQSERLFAVAREPKRFVGLRSAGHNHVTDDERYEPSLREFIQGLSDNSRH